MAARYSGSELRVFIGGTIEAATTAATGSLVATTEALWLGHYNATSHHLNGYLDDVSIYNSALSDAAITSLSNNRPGRYEYHHTNALGSNIVLTDDRKNVIARYEYDVFGAVRVETGTSDNAHRIKETRSKYLGSCQKEVLRDFEKPSFFFKTRFHPHILDMSECLIPQ